VILKDTRKANDGSPLKDDAACQNPGCKARFRQLRKHHVYCSPACKFEVWARVNRKGKEADA